ncbi:MAG: sugar ABC transporter substrate-binding protein [Actinobacteria bacterium]|nr:sugar ABC transporter substrate-binding protein [Actinomycetota bacterium]
MKKTLIWVVVLVIVVSMAFIGFGCKKSTTTETTAAESTTTETTVAESTKTASAEPITIRFSYWQDPLKTFDKLAAQFEKDHPNVKVSLEVVPGDTYNDKLLVQLSSGTAPDVITIAPQYWPDYVEAGLLENLEPYIAKDEMFKDGDPIIPQLWKTSTFEGNRYGIPGYFATQVLYYNKDLFKQAGLPTPSELVDKGEWTWDKMVELASQLTKKGNDGVVTQYGFRMMFWWWGSYLPDLWMNDGDLLGELKGSDWSKSTIDSSAAQDVFASYLSLIDKKIAPDPLTLQKGEEPLGFETGKIAMSWDGDWWMGSYAKQEGLNWDVAPLPSRKTQKTVLYTDSYNINKASKNKDMAWEFLKLVALSQDSQIEIGNEGLRPPSIKALITDPELSKKWINPEIYPEHYASVIKLAVENSMTPPYRTKWAAIETEALTPILQKIFLKEATVENGLKEIAEKINSILAEQ